MVFNGGQMRGAGQAYQSGYFKGMVLAIAADPGQTVRCTTEPYDTTPLVAIVAYVKANPEQWGSRRTSLIEYALSSYKPCKR